MITLGQKGSQVYFSDSLFCIVEYSNEDTLWHIEKDKYVKDSIVTWSFGTVEKTKDTVKLNCFLIYYQNKELYKCDEWLWAKTISLQEYYEKSITINIEKVALVLPELASRFISNFYSMINKQEHNILTSEDRIETVKAYKCLDYFLNHFHNDSLKFIKRITSYLDSTQIDFYERAVNNFVNKNYGEALFYSKLYPYVEDSINNDEKFEIDEIYEISMIHYLDLQHEYAYFNQYNYLLVDKFEQSKEMFPNAQRYGDVWWK